MPTKTVKGVKYHKKGGKLRRVKGKKYKGKKR